MTLLFFDACRNKHVASEGHLARRIKKVLIHGNCLKQESNLRPSHYEYAGRAPRRRNPQQLTRGEFKLFFLFDLLRRALVWGALPPLFGPPLVHEVGALGIDSCFW